jgi:hypothetical protein
MSEAGSQWAGGQPEGQWAGRLASIVLVGQRADGSWVGWRMVAWWAEKLTFNEVLTWYFFLSLVI